MKIVFSLLPLLSGVLALEPPKDVEPAACSNYGLPAESFDRYHADTVCDRTGYNNYKEALERHKTYRRLMQSNEINQVPNQQTVFCPLQVQDLAQEGQVNGYDTVWLVENTSKEPVVLSFVKKDGLEYSAIHPDITPPQKDPEAVLSPNNWRAIYAWDGHVFHARSYDRETGALGPVVMQHRTGLIPVGTKAQDLSCPLEDPEPIVEGVRDPEYSRTTPQVFRPCNTIDIGFRNMANCPLNGYFIAGDSETCQEKFKFHLGTNMQPQDFMWGWDSRTKFEGSFVGHSFAFRSAANPSILVDTVTLQPTRITDCPELKVKQQINQVTKIADVEEIALPLTNEGDVATKSQLLEDTLVRVDRRVIASMFNETMGMNATSTHTRSATRSPLDGNVRVMAAGINSL